MYVDEFTSGYVSVRRYPNTNFSLISLRSSRFEVVYAIADRRDYAEKSV